MKKLCVYKSESGYIVRVTRGNVKELPNCIGYLPGNTPGTDFDFVDVKDGQPFICQKKKSAWIKEQIKNAISE